ncbi:hypothetical protein BGZ76_006577 [Entomortierella beljakovae]|nr:hypothetical protein BGZ76_006577 [Entomortierella beljakovae]
MATTAHKLIQEDQTRGIAIHDWVVRSHKTSILNSQEIDSATADLGIPIPEMIFGNNFLSIQHKGGFKLEFKALPALAMVDKSAGSSDLIKVSYASEWFNTRAQVNREHITDTVKPYDWTYSTKYNGTILSDNQFEKTTSETIDIEQLKKPDPIFFYDENILFEDELADNGTAVLTTKMKIPPSKGDDLSLLLDSNWVSSQLPEKESYIEVVRLE